MAGRLLPALRRFAVGSSSAPPPTTGSTQLLTRAILAHERDYSRDVGNGSGSNLIVSVVEYVCNAFMEAPIQVKEGEEVVSPHAMVQLIRRPNKFYGGSLLWHATLGS